MSTRKPDSANKLASDTDAADQLLDESLRAIAPLVDLLIAEGVGYPTVSRALRTLFVDSARAQLQDEGAALTDAAISLRSGVHRKEVKAVAQQQATPAADDTNATRTLSVAEQVFTRWITDAAYRDRHSKPAVLPVSGAAPSFESLVNEVTRDFSRRTVLDELVRIGLVREANGSVEPLTDAMVPPPSAWSELAHYLGNHLHDHMAAGAANLKAARRDQEAPFLEHSMYANGLTDLSIEQLSGLAKEVWMPAFNQMVGAAQQRYALDSQNQDEPSGRLRFGVYLYSEPDDSQQPKPELNQDAAQSRTAKRPKKSKGQKKSGSRRSRP